MADFNTHFFVSTTVGAVYATISTKALGIAPQPALLLAALTAIGGVLPDIDLKESTPGKALFLMLGALVAVTAMLQHVAKFSVLELLVIGAVLFVFVRYVLWSLFHRFTVHRGSLHSIAASVMFGTMATVLCHTVWSLEAKISWLSGIGVCLGSVTHLVLDEAYSVDFTGARIKRSFGSALKVVDTVRWPGSLAVVLVTVVGLWLSPPIAPLMVSLKEVNPHWQEWLLALDF